MNEKNIKEIRKRHTEEIKKFQDNCKHRSISDWMDQQWAPAHSTGHSVKLCNICEKIMEHKSTFPDSMHPAPVIFPVIQECTHEWYVEYDEEAEHIATNAKQTKWRCKKCLLLRYTND